MTSGRVLVTGGGGYVGAVLVPKLLNEGYHVRVLDVFLYGRSALAAVADHEKLEIIEGDIRDAEVIARATLDCDHVIHLACISNDPSFELNPDLGKTINLDAFQPLVLASKRAGVGRFIYASSSSVYGVSEASEVAEDHPLRPMTDYSQFKADCEPLLLSELSDDFTPIVIRPATVCGASPRLRLDLTVNILTAHALVNKKITVFGGSQKRPNIHIEDMTDLYLHLLRLPTAQVAGKTYNAGYQNHTVLDIAKLVRKVVAEESGGADDVAIVTTPTNDLRSYHISSDRIQRELGFVPKHTIEDAVRDLVKYFASGTLVDPMQNPLYYNVKLMKDSPLL